MFRMVLAWVVALGVAGCAVEPVQVSEAGAPAVGVRVAANGTVDVRGLRADLENGHVPVLIDVREPWEYEAGHVPSAKNIPLGAIEGRLGELAPYKDGPVYVVCQSGSRSLAASQTLVSHGFDAVNVTGGTRAWRSAGLAVE